MDNSIVTFLWLICLPLLASPIIYLVGRICFNRHMCDRSNPARWLALAALLGTTVFYVLSVKLYMAGAMTGIKIGDIALRVDGVGLVLSGVVLLLGILVTLYSFAYMAREDGQEKFYALLVMMIGTIIGLGFASDLFNLWIWFEAMAISSYLLVAFYRNQPASLEAGFKYLVQSAAGSVLVLLGIALVFSQTGTLDFVEIRTILSYGAAIQPILLAAGALFLVGYGVKTALVPMHTWLPDAHSQAPSGISAMLSGVVIEAGLVALIKSIGLISLPEINWGVYLLGFGCINMLLGNLLALRQTQVKRLLAFSSLAHMGYILVGVGVLVAFGKVDGGSGAFFHVITHSLMKGLGFLAAGALLYALYIANGKHGDLMNEDLNGAAQKYPVVAFSLAVALLALGGLPPLAGFMSKWQIFVAGIQTTDKLAVCVVIFAALNSVLSLGYYAPLVNRMYRLQPSEAVKAGQPVSAWIWAPLLVMALVIVFLGVWPSSLSWLTNLAGTSLLTVFGG